MKATWGSLTIVSEEKSIARDFEDKDMTNKQKTINRAIWENKFIDFIDSKSDQELEENDIKDRILYAVEINKLIVKNTCRKTTEKKLAEIKEPVNRFDNLYEKRARVGFPS